jgi:hypothetical protein
MAEIDRDVIVDVAAQLLMAAITLRDITDALPPDVMAGCPPDIADRLMRHYYQHAFDALPADIQAEARAIVMTDPAIIAAREVDARGRPDAA